MWRQSVFPFAFLRLCEKLKTTSLSCLQHFDISPVVFAGIPSYALHTCLGTVVPNGTYKKVIYDFKPLEFEGFGKQF